MLQTKLLLSVVQKPTECASKAQAEVPGTVITVYESRERMVVRQMCGQELRIRPDSLNQRDD